MDKKGKFSKQLGGKQIASKTIRRSACDEYTDIDVVNDLDVPPCMNAELIVRYFRFINIIYNTPYIEYIRKNTLMIISDKDYHREIKRRCYLADKLVEINKRYLEISGDASGSSGMSLSLSYFFEIYRKNGLKYLMKEMKKTYLNDRLKELFLNELVFFDELKEKLSEIEEFTIEQYTKNGANSVNENYLINLDKFVNIYCSFSLITPAKANWLNYKWNICDKTPAKSNEKINKKARRNLRSQFQRTKMVEDYLT